MITDKDFLFSGFSLIFVFEVIYWLIVTFKKAIKFPSKTADAKPTLEIEWKTSELVAKIFALEEKIEQMEKREKGNDKKEQEITSQNEDNEIEKEVEDQVVVNIE